MTNPAELNFLCRDCGRRFRYTYRGKCSRCRRLKRKWASGSTAKMPAWWDAHLEWLTARAAAELPLGPSPYMLRLRSDLPVRNLLLPADIRSPGLPKRH